MLRPALLFPAAVLLAACSRTAPDTRWPPPGPAGGLPYVPLPDESERDEAAPVATPAPTTPPRPKAIDGALPAAPPASLSRQHACKDKQCKLDAFLPDPTFAQAAPSGADSPGALWLEDVAESSVLVVPRHHQLELFVLALAGSALVSGDDGGAGIKLSTWSALRAPGVGVNIKAETGAKLLLGLATKSGTLTSAIEQAKKRPFEVRWKTRPAPLSHVTLTSARDLSWSGGSFHARIAFGSETPTPGSWGVLLTAPDAEIREHDHPTWEHVAVLDGSAQMRIGGKSHPVEPGSVFDLAPGEKHGLSPAGSRGLVVVQMYTPSGPEQRFVKLAEAEAKKK